MPTKYDLDGQPIDRPSKVETAKGHNPPKKLRDTPAARIPKAEGPIEVKADIDRRLDELTKDARQPKPTIKERAMTAILNQLIAFLKTWLYGRPVYKTRVSTVTGEVEFVLDDKGKKVMNVPLTILGRLMQLLGALGLLTSMVWGKSVAEWGTLIEKIFGLL